MVCWCSKNKKQKSWRSYLNDRSFRMWHKWWYRKKTEFGFRNAILILRWWLQEPAAPASVLTQAGIVCEVLSWWNRNTVGIPVNSQTSNHPCLDLEEPAGSWHFPSDWFWPQIGSACDLTYSSRWKGKAFMPWVGSDGHFLPLLWPRIQVTPNGSTLQPARKVWGWRQSWGHPHSLMKSPEPGWPWWAVHHPGQDPDLALHVCWWQMMSILMG